MTLLNKNVAPQAQTKQDFTKKKTLNAPKSIVVKTYEDDDNIEICKRLCFFGGIGTGKTYVLYQLLKLGYKVFYLSTDVGGGGIETVELEAINRGEKHILKNLRSVELSGYDEVQQFLESPESVYPDIYDFDPDWLYWDGFASYHQVDVSEYVGDLDQGQSSDDNKKIVSEAITTGVQFEQRHWGQVKNITMRAIANFMAIHNAKTGRFWNKIVTAHEEVRMLDAKQRSAGKAPVSEQGYPMISGKAYNLFCGSFSAVIRTVKTRNEKDEAEFWYSVGEDNKAEKTRGFKMPDKMRADVGELLKLMGSEKKEG